MEKIEILQKFLEGIVPEEDNYSVSLRANDNLTAAIEESIKAGMAKGFNLARGKMIKNIKEADLEKLIHELQ